MIKLEIRKGYLDITDENGQSYPGWIGDDPPLVPSWLPEPDFAYQKCVAAGYTQERTIDFMLDMFHRERLIRSGFLAEMELVIGLVGPRGAGKSVGGSAIAIYDYLLCRIPVVSNMDISVVVRYKQASKMFKSTSLDKASLLNVKDLDQMYRNCCIFVDEANLELSEARRSMSNRALWFSYSLQQARKRHINLIHTEQSEMHVDDRLRFQTSLFISCKDAAYQDGVPQPGSLGRKSVWKVHDISGVVQGQIYDDNRLVVLERNFHNTPFWHSFDTNLIQTGEIAQPTDGIEIREGAVLAALKDKYAEGRAILDQYSGNGQLLVRVWCDLLWKSLGIGDNIKKQSAIGSQLGFLGATKHRSTGDRAFYRFPEKSKYID